MLKKESSKKIYRFPNRAKFVSSGASSNRNERREDIKVPLITISGKWLRKIGFREGADYIIIPEEGKITLIRRDMYSGKELIQENPRNAVWIEEKPKKNVSVIGKIDKKKIKKSNRQQRAAS